MWWWWWYERIAPCAITIMIMSFFSFMYICRYLCVVFCMVISCNKIAIGFLYSCGVYSTLVYDFRMMNETKKWDWKEDGNATIKVAHSTARSTYTCAYKIKMEYAIWGSWKEEKRVYNIEKESTARVLNIKSSEIN